MARFEPGTSPVPSEHANNLAVLLGCPPSNIELCFLGKDKLLEMKDFEGIFLETILPITLL